MGGKVRICKRGHEVSGGNKLADGACRECKLEGMRRWMRENRPPLGVRSKRKYCPNGHEYVDCAPCNRRKNALSVIQFMLRRASSLNDSIAANCGWESK